MLQSSVQQARLLHEYQRHKSCAIDCASFLSLFYELFADCMSVRLLNAGLEHSRPKSFSKNVIILFSEYSAAGIYFNFLLFEVA